MVSQLPKVGIGVLVFKDNKVLLAKRKGSLGDGEYSGIGGHLEFDETFEQCAKREAKEEAGIKIGNLKLLTLINLTKYPGKHYVDIGFSADWVEGEPQVLETEKCAGWGWYDIDNLPTPLLATDPYYIEAYKTGKIISNEL